MDFQSFLNFISRLFFTSEYLERVVLTFFLDQKRIPSLKVEIWPGYITSIRQHEQDILLCAEITHKIMRVETVYDVLNRIRKEERDYKNAAEKALLGSTVLTDFNNKTYRIDDIRWDESPKNTFPHSTMGDVSFADYFKNVSIRAILCG